MKNRKRRLEIKTRLVILLLTLFSFTPLVLMGIFYFNINWKILVPLEIIAVVSMQGILHFFFRPDKKCPQCNAPVSIYAEFCRNCGLKLLKKCSNCGNIMTREATECQRCGKKYKIVIIPEDAELTFEYEEGKRERKHSGSYCPHCGTSLESDTKKREYCDVCGGSLK